MVLITDLEDGRMTMFRGYVASGGVGFMGHEFLLFCSLQAALEQLVEFKKLTEETPGEDPEETPDETGDEGTG